MSSQSLNASTLCWNCLKRLHSPAKYTNRNFTTSSAHRTALPTFSETSSPDLNALLTTLRSNVFLPSLLNSAQRALIYRKKNIPILSNPAIPVTVTIGADTHTLKHLSHTKDEPNAQKSLLRALTLMRETGDWSNIQALLVGLRTANRNILPAQLQKTLRLLNEAGEQGRILQLCQDVRYTGVKLDSWPIVKEVLLGAVFRILRYNDGLDGVEGIGREQAMKRAVREGVKHATKVWELLWDEKHAGDGSKALRKRVEVVAVLTLVHALRAKVGVAEEKIVAREACERYGRMMVRQWKGLPGVEQGEKIPKAERWRDANELLLPWAPVAKAASVAGVVLKDTRLGEDVKEMGNEVKNEVERLVGIVRAEGMADGKRRGVSMAEELDALEV